MNLEGVEQKHWRQGPVNAMWLIYEKKEFIKDYVYPVLKTGALYEGSYLLGTSMARPVIAKSTS